MNDLRTLLNKRVVIQNRSGARYAGVLVGFRDREKQFCLSDLAIVNRQGAYTVSGSRETRWFKTDAFAVSLESVQ